MGLFQCDKALFIETLGMEIRLRYYAGKKKMGPILTVKIGVRVGLDAAEPRAFFLSRDFANVMN